MQRIAESLIELDALHWRFLLYSPYTNIASVLVIPIGVITFWPCNGVGCAPK